MIQKRENRTDELTRKENPVCMAGPVAGPSLAPGIDSVSRAGSHLPVWCVIYEVLNGLSVIVMLVGAHADTGSNAAA